MQKIIAIIVCCCWGAVSWAQPNINRVEYFFNTDPGFGNATNVPILASNNIDTGFVANIANLPLGLNSMYIRSRDANGKWSVTNRFLFVRLSPVVTAPNINKAEYFIDTDPGFGNGTNVPVAASPDIANIVVGVNLTGLSEGLHSLYVRSRDALGNWSVTNRFLFVRSSIPVAAPNITRAEYFFDTDPGFGNAIPIPVTPGPDLSTIPVSLHIDSLGEGLHSFFIRSQSATGRWSVTNRWLFVRATPNPSAGVADVEYFIDTDPGFGKGVPIAINTALNIPDYISPVNITGLSVGDHRLYIRSKSAEGKWSVTNIITFPIAALVATPSINVNGITNKNMCGATSFKLSYHATGTYNVGNVFTVQLSNAAGSFTSPTAIGSFAGTVSSIVNCTIPLHIADGNAYKVRVVSSNPAVTGIVSDTVFTLFNQPSFNDTTVFIVCANETVDLTAVYNTTGFTTQWNTGNPANAGAGVYRLASANTAKCTDTAFVTVKQDIATWTGTVSTNWHTAGNWSINRVPSEKTHVIIATGTPNICELSVSDVNISSLQVKPGAVLNVLNSRKANITAKCNPLPPG